MRRAQRLYRRLLDVALPFGTGTEDREEMASVFDVMLRAAARRGRRARGALWARVIVDLAWTAVVVRVRRAGPTEPEESMARWGGGGSGLAGARQALRSVWRRPGRTVAATGTIAMAVGAGTLVTALVRDVLLAPLPYRAQEQLVRLREHDENGRAWWPSRANFEDWRRAAPPAVTGLEGATAPNPLPVLLRGRAVRADVAEASAGLFALLGARYEHGRGPTLEEGSPGGVPVAVVSHAFWARELSGDLGDVALVVGTETFPVVGVLEPDFGFLASGGAWGRPDVWLPMERAADTQGRRAHGIHVVARSVPGATLDRVDADLDRMAARVAEDHGERTDAAAVLTTSLEADLVGAARRPLGFLVATAGGVLLVAMLNLAGTLIVDGLGRQRELAVRRALGAARPQLVGQLLAEASVAAVPGAALGLAVAWCGLASVRWLDPGALPRLADVGIRPGTFLVAAAIGLGTAVVAAVVPGLLFSRGEGGSLGSAARVGTSGSMRRLWSATIALQVALTFTLLVGTGGLWRGLSSVVRSDLGYQPQGVLAVQVALPESRYPSRTDVRAFYEEALDAVRAVPGVGAVSPTNVLPHVTQAMFSPARDPDGGSEDMVWSGLRTVDDAYFDVLGIPLLGGAFPEAGAPPSAVVDRTVADKLLGGVALGRRVQSGMTGVPVAVTGVVGPVREWGIEMGRIGTLYVDFRSFPQALAEGWLLVRGQQGRLPPADDVRRALAGVDAQVPVVLEPLQVVLGRTLGSARLVLGVTAAFGVLGLLFAAVGIWVVVGYVARRSARDSGVRLVLGARPGAVRGRAMARGLWPAAMGVGAGVGLALLGARLVATRVPDAASAGPATWLAAAALLLLVAGVAGYPPARRTTRVDLSSVLREE